MGVSHARTRRSSVALASIIAALVLAVAFVVTLCLGDQTTAPSQLWSALTGHAAENTVYAVTHVRLPRAVLAVLVGAAFGLAGGLSQSVLRNPLASPDVLGISSGASTAVVAVIAVGSLGGAIGFVSLPVAAVAGGLFVAAIIAFLARHDGLRSRRILLIGIAISTGFTGITQYLLTTIDVLDAQRAATWLTGSLNARTWSDAWPVAVGLAVLLPAAMVLARTTRALLFDDDLTTNWGIRSERMRALLLLMAVVLAALATAAAGPVAFVALVSGQLARKVARVPDIPPVLSALVGATIVLIADTIARVALPYQLPVGVLTALVGAPYLLYLLQRPRKGTR